MLVIEKDWRQCPPLFPRTYSCHCSPHLIPAQCAESAAPWTLPRQRVWHRSGAYLDRFRGGRTGLPSAWPSSGGHVLIALTSERALLGGALRRGPRISSAACSWSSSSSRSACRATDGAAVRDAAPIPIPARRSPRRMDLMVSCAPQRAVRTGHEGRRRDVAQSCAVSHAHGRHDTYRSTTSLSVSWRRLSGGSTWVSTHSCR